MAGAIPDAGNLAGQMQETQQRLAFAQAELAETELTGTAGGGLVKVTMRGNGEVTRVVFDPAVFDVNDAESLGTLTLAAISQAADAVRSVATEKVMAAVASLEAARAAGLPYA
jgi:DNA-binding YbaB/EbfC family protein